ncbi:MAG: DciA family protein [Phycisphaerae bacterium]
MIGACVEKLVARAGVQGDAAAQALASAITELVDDEFRSHCRVTVMDGRTLVINVDGPGLVYPMRMRWLAPLRRAQSASSWGHRVNKIVFEFGTTGVVLTRPDKDQS